MRGMPEGGLCANSSVDMTPQPPARGKSPAIYRAKVQQAKGLCLGCPILGPCREWALSLPHLRIDGVVGGMTQDERRRARQGR